MDTTTTEWDRTAITGEPDPGALGAIEFVVHPPLMNVRIMRTKTGKVCGIAQIQTQRGPITFIAAVDEKVLRDLVARALAYRVRLGHLPFATSGALDEIAGHAAANAAKAKVLHTLIEQAKTVGLSPQVARALGLSTVVIPGQSGAVLALEHATELLARLKRRDPKAILAWKKVAAAARAGNPKARRAMHIVHLVAKAPRIVARH
ncbi:MAG TPA: hypothetical protein VJT73_09360 [Polyangiaceae bacterium]|nr:hypothetical protein [Polyangiaceae bacterium]